MHTCTYVCICMYICIHWQRKVHKLALKWRSGKDSRASERAPSAIIHVYFNKLMLKRSKTQCALKAKYKIKN